MILFKNRGNNCFFHSMLQILLNIKSYSEFFIKNNISNDVLIELKRLYELNDGIHLIDNFKTILSKTHNELFGNNYQQDSSEALLVLLELIHENTKISFKSLAFVSEYSQAAKSWNADNKMEGYSFLTDQSIGQTRDVLICLGCGAKTINFRQFKILSLSLRSSIWRCLEFYEEKEEVFRDCNCGSKKSSKEIEIWKFPKVLFISLLRFSQDEYGSLCRVETDVTINQVIRFSINDILSKYKLNSIVNHYGKSPNSGHYTATMRQDNGTWVTADDSAEEKVELSSLGEFVYILCYVFDK